MKSKKFLLRAFLCIISLLLLLAGCDNGDVIEATTDTAASSETVGDSETTGSTGSGGRSNRTRFSNKWTQIKEKDVDEKELSINLVEIDIEGDDEIIIYQATDIHFNDAYSNESQDIRNGLTAWKGIEEENTNANIIANVQRHLNHATVKGADQIVVTGDLANFYSKANMDHIKNYIFDPYDNIMAVAGNHDATVAGYNQTTIDNNIASIKNQFGSYGYGEEYTSKVIDNRVKLIMLDNAIDYDKGIKGFTQEQADLLEADLKSARDNGQIVLLFYHVPLKTDLRADPRQAYTSGISGDNDPVYKLITNNADIIKGGFCGHTHANVYSEIKAKTASGEDALVPQYETTAMYIGEGTMLKIVIK